MLISAILLVAASGAQLDPSGAGGDPISWWSFNGTVRDQALDEARPERDTLHGSIDWVPGVIGTAAKLDGFRSYVRRERNDSAGPVDAFTVEGWVALARYPWSWSPLVDCSYPETKGFFLGVGPEGHVAFRVAAGSSWYEATTDARIPLREWVHVAATFEPDRKATVFVNGEPAAVAAIEGNYVPARNGSLTIGRNNLPQTWVEFQLTTESTFFHLDGLLDEIKILDRVRTGEEIRAELAALDQLPTPALSVPTELPTGPRGSGSFGAFYTRLDYYEEWDDLWRVSDVPDLYVRFDQSPVQLVFWRGASFVPCWVNENGTWYTNEWLETWGADVASCAEPIMDRQCRFSHVRLIENTEARVVIHWRYALSDAFYDIAAVGDDGRGEWCDEFYTIYPDQVGVRRMDLHYSRPERKHDWVEQIVVLPPGRYPEDVVEKEAISLVNMAGVVQAYSWDDDLAVEMPLPEGANISLVNLKSRYRPFIVVSPDPVDTVEGKWDSPFFRTYAAHMARGYRPDPVPSVFGWWDHWPVAQIPGDGRWVTTPDRPSHFNLTTFVQWKDHEYTEKTRTRIMLQGMTDQEPEGLVSLARSWLEAPKMRVLAEEYHGGTYDQAERTYVLEKLDPGSTAGCRLVVEASEDSPLMNPAIIIQGWGSGPAAVSIDGEAWPRGVDCRQGVRRQPDSEDLILWLRLSVRDRVEIVVQPAGGR